MTQYLREGMLVELNKELPNKPVMMVYNVLKKEVTEENPFKTLDGIECIWFTEGGLIQKEKFNFKDLIPWEEEGND